MAVDFYTPGDLQRHYQDGLALICEEIANGHFTVPIEVERFRDSHSHTFELAIKFSIGSDSISTGQVFGAFAKGRLVISQHPNGMFLLTNPPVHAEEYATLKVRFEYRPDGTCTFPITPTDLATIRRLLFDRLVFQLMEQSLPASQISI